jgi:ribosome biogenesis protein ENP2
LAHRSQSKPPEIHTVTCLLLSIVVPDFYFSIFFPTISTTRFAISKGRHINMKLSNQSEVPVYTISGSNTARPLPEWLARRRKRSLKNDPEYANRIELLQDFEFEEASHCIRVSEDGDWVMSTGEAYSAVKRGKS